MTDTLTLSKTKFSDNGKLFSSTFCFAVDEETELLLENRYPKSKCGADTAEMRFYLFVHVKHGVYQVPVKQRLLASTLINGLPRYHMQKVLTPLHVRGTNLSIRLVIAAPNRVDHEQPLIIRGECCTLEGQSYCKPPDIFQKSVGVSRALKSALSKDRGNNKLTARMKQQLSEALRLQRVRDEFEALVIDGIRSGPATPMTEENWQQLHNKVKTS